MIVSVTNTMQSSYSYARSRNPGDLSDHPEFQPAFTPLEMLKMGVFEGRYFDPNSTEFPPDWTPFMRLSSDEVQNFFKIKSRQPLSVWRASGWIHADDPRGWFEWYCRFWLGRRHEDDARQIGRWQSFGPRHQGQIQLTSPANGNPGHPNIQKRTRQRQALLQWSWDPFV